MKAESYDCLAISSILQTETFLLIHLLLSTVLGHQVDNPITLKLGEISKASLAKKEKQDFVIDLVKGTYRVVLDTTAADESGKPVNVVQGSLKLIKRNGASTALLPYDFMSWYEYDAQHRQVAVFKLTKNLGVRLRLNNSDLSASTNYVSVAPYKPNLPFVPFGFGAEVLAAKVGTEEGVGGTLDDLGYAYYKAELPVGTWTVSLGLRRPAGSDAYLCGNVAFLDEAGARLDVETVKVDVTGDTGRGERDLVIKKQRTILFRVKNTSNNHKAWDYDLTINKAEG